MAETTDKYTIEIDTAIANQKINELTKDQADLIKQMTDLERAGKQNTDKFKEMANSYAENAENLKQLRAELEQNTSVVDGNTDKVEENTKEVEKNTDAVKENKKTLDKQADAGTKVGGVLSSSINAYNKAGGGIKGMTAAAKAFIATPIGKIIAAIVTALGLLKKALAGSASGQRSLNKVTALVTGTLDFFMQKVRNIVSAISGVLGKLFNNFKNILPDMIGENVDLADELYQLEDKESKLRVRQSEYEKQIAEQRRIAADTTKTAAERDAANQNVRKLTVKSIDEEIALEKERLKLLQKKHSLTDSSREDIQEERDTQIRINELEAQKKQALQQTDKVQTRITNSAEKEADAQEKAAEAAKKKREEAEKEAKTLEERLKSETDTRTDTQKLKDELDARKALLDQWYKDDIIAKEKYNELKELAEQSHKTRMAEIEDKAKKESDAKAKKEKDEKEKQDKALYEAKWKIANDGMNALQEIVSIGGEKTFAATKALQIGEVAMNTTKAAMDAYASAFRPENPGIGVPGVAAAQGAARMATVIATGLAQIAKISSQKPSKSASISKSVSGGGGGTGTIVDTSYSTTTTSQLTGVQGDLATMNMGRTGVRSESNRQTIAVVVDDVTAKQNSQSRIQKMNVL